MPGYVWRGPKNKESIASGFLAEDAHDPTSDMEQVTTGQPLGINFYESDFGTNRWHLKATPHSVQYEFSVYASIPSERRTPGFTMEQVIGAMKRARRSTWGLKRELARASRKAAKAHKRLKV